MLSLQTSSRYTIDVIQERGVETMGDCWFCHFFTVDKERAQVNKRSSEGRSILLYQIEITSAP